MNLDELQSVRDRERQTDKLQQLRESFYADAGEFIQQRRRERERAAERADDPFDAPEVNRLTDEINTAEGTVEAIFERRIGKIVKAASLAAADQPMDADGMTAEETVLFEDLVDDIVAARHRVFDTLDGGTTEGAADAAETSPVRSAGDGTPAPDTDPAGEPTGRERGTAVDEGRGTAASPVDSERGTEPGHDSGAEPGRGPAQESDPDADSVSAADLMGGDAGGTATGAGGGSGGDAESEPEPEPGPGSGAQPEPGSDPEVGDASAVAGPTESDTTAPSDRDNPDGDAPVRNDGGAVARETVRITDDVGEIFGVDEREYDLLTDDVVQLPAANARPLVERDAAERID